MTFEEAKRIKDSHPNPYIKEGNLWTIYVVPALERDYIKFLATLKKGKNLTDEDSKTISTDNNYNVVALMMKAFNVYEANL